MGTSGSCPQWMYNYLKDTSSNGMTASSASTGQYGYWTSSARSDDTTRALNVISDGSVDWTGTSYTSRGARAVVEIYKDPSKPYNNNIVNAWAYNESSCQENDGESCTPTTCYQNSAAGSCEPGTIIDYKVNSSTTVRFHVIKDDGKTMRLQQQKNITSLNGTKWYATSNDNTDGPSTILPALENATSSWTNVETQNYTLGTTTFDGVTSVGCTWTDGSAPNSSNCTSATYTKLGGSASGLTRSAKARLITAQEAGTLGCKMGTNGSCPKWMINYLNDGHTNSGAKFYDTANTAGNYGYWTSSALAANAAGALGVYYYGYVSHPYTTGTNFGARAVVVINK